MQQVTPCFSCGLPVDVYHAVCIHGPVANRDTVALSCHQACATHVAALLLDAFHRSLDHHANETIGTISHHAPITARERDVLQGIVDGLSNREIGQRHFLTEKTVTNYTRAIYQKLHVANRSQAAVYVLQHGLLDTAPPQT